MATIFNGETRREMSRGHRNLGSAIFFYHHTCERALTVSMGINIANYRDLGLTQRIKVILGRVGPLQKGHCFHTESKGISLPWSLATKN